MRGMRAEEPGGPDILQVEELAPLVAGAPACIVGAGVHGTRAGRGRGSSHGFSSEDMPSVFHHLRPYFFVYLSTSVCREIPRHVGVIGYILRDLVHRFNSVPPAIRMYMLKCFSLSSFPMKYLKLRWRTRILYTLNTRPHFSLSRVGMRFPANFHRHLSLIELTSYLLYSRTEIF